jgi:hypothetical protein
LTAPDDLQLKGKLESAGLALKRNKVQISLVTFVFLLGFAFYTWIFSLNQLMPMVDGPFYLIQVRSLLTTGTLVYGDPPLTFYLLAFFALLVGDISLGVKVGVSFFCALSTIPAFFLMKRVGGSTFAGVLAMLLVVFSGPYISMLTDFIKNAVGICFLLVFVYFLHDLAFAGFRKPSLVLATFFLLLTGMTHILDFGFAVLFLIFYSAMALVFNCNRRRYLKSLGLMTLAVAAFVFIAATFFSSLFTDFGKLFSFLSSLGSSQSGGGPLASLISSLVSQGPGPPPNQLGLISINGWSLVLAILSIGTILLLYVWKTREKEAMLLLGTTTIIGAITTFPLIPSAWLDRFLLMVVIPSAVLVSYGLSRVWHLKMKQSKLIALVLAVLCLSFFVVQSMNAVATVRPTISDAAYQDLTVMKDEIPANSVIVVPQQLGVHYWIQYAEDADVLGYGAQLSPSLWQTYAHVFGIFYRGQLPIGNYQTLLVGSVFVLVEFQTTNSSATTANI